MLVDVARLEREYYERKPDTGRPDAARRLRHQRPPRLTTRAARSPRPTSRRSPRPSATTGVARGSTARCTWARTRTRCPSPRSAPRSRCWRPTASRPSSSATTGVTPTPVISRAILVLQPRPHAGIVADGIVVTPSHNPPEDGGFKYNPPNGGPADTDVTAWIQDRANDLLARRQRRRQARCRSRRPSRPRPRTRKTSSCPTSRIWRTSSTWTAIRAAGLTLGVDPLGGAAVPYWEPINAVYRLDIAVVNPVIDPTFSFMTVDHDGKIRMDSSSPYAMARLVELKDQFRRRLRQRPRRRPARHRDALRGADEPQPLPGRGHPLPARRTARAGRPTPPSARRWSAAA